MEFDFGVIVDRFQATIGIGVDRREAIYIGKGREEIREKEKENL